MKKNFVGYLKKKFEAKTLRLYIHAQIFLVTVMFFFLIINKK